MRLSAAVIPLPWRRRPAVPGAAVSRAPAASRPGGASAASARQFTPSGVAPIAVAPEVDLAQRVRESGEW